MWQRLLLVAESQQPSADGVIASRLERRAGARLLGDSFDPQLITSFESFKNRFGKFEKDNTGNKILAHAVYGFFNNGGTRCWVTRVDDVTQVTDVRKALKGFRRSTRLRSLLCPER